MSDDDGMLLNFTTETESAAAVSSKRITGGRWKDRRKLRILMNKKKETDIFVDNITDNKVDEIDQPLKKKAKPNDLSTFNKPNRYTSTLKTKEIDQSLAANSHSKKVIPSSEIVSSLFTSNRDIDTDINNNAVDETLVVKPSNAPLKGDSFDGMGINAQLVKHLEEKLRIKKPTSIQKTVIPHLSSLAMDNDLFIHAQTGSGKTLAFLLPIFNVLLKMKDTQIDRKSGCFALIVAPTRELAQQIYSVATSLVQCCHYLVPCLLIGGERKKSEKARLRKGCNFIIGTPGRILDHLQNTQSIKEQLGSSLRYVILDEGDKLMELGFEETLTQILQIVHGMPLDFKSFPNLPKRIMHVLCSATKTGSVTKLGNVALKNYKLLSNGKDKKTNSQELTVAPDQLKQMITIVPPKLRLVTLGAELNNLTKQHFANENSKDTVTRTMVFLSCSDSVEFHFEALTASESNYKNIAGDSVRELKKNNDIFPCLEQSEVNGVIIYKLHGSLSQQMRTSTLKHFAANNDSTNGKHLIMLCTDVASRGLDLPHVGTVVEFDPPFSVEDHLHRIGRTARAGRSGSALLFLLPGEEEGYMDYIKQYHPLGWRLLKFDQDILKPSFIAIHVGRSDRKSKKDNEDSKKILDWDTNATTWHLNLERRILEDSQLKNLALKGYSSYVRAYATHISVEKKFFNVRCLHLGHIAKSFGLRERPKTMGIQNKKIAEEDGQIKRTKENPKNVMFRRARMAVKESASEFNY